MRHGAEVGHGKWLVDGIKRAELVSDWWIFSVWTDCCLARNFVQTYGLDWFEYSWVGGCSFFL